MKKTVLCVGSTTGFGNLIVEQFAKSEWDVIATHHGAVAPSWEYPKIKTILFDLMQLDSFSSLESYLSAPGTKPVDTIVISAGQMVLGEFESYSDQEIDDALDINFKAIAKFIIRILPFMSKERGKIIVISSVAGVVGLPFMSMYSASKFALEGFLEGIRYELKLRNIWVSVVRPGSHKTGFASRAIWGMKTSDRYASFRVQFKEFQRNLIHKASDPCRVAKVVKKIAESRSEILYTEVGIDALALVNFRRFLPFRIFRAILNRIFC